MKPSHRAVRDIFARVSQASASFALDLASAAGLWLSLVSAIGALLANAGRFSLKLDGLSHFAPLWCLACAIAGGVGLVTTGRVARSTTVLAAVGLSASLVLMAPELAAALTAERVKPMAETVRIIQFNAWAGNPDQERSARWLLAQDADFILIEESDNLTPVLSEILAATYPTRISCYVPGHCPTVILAKRPALAAEGYWRTPNPRDFAWGRFAGSQGPFDIIVGHMSWPYPAAPQARQRSDLLALVSPLERETLIVGGDFNSTPWSFALRDLDRAIGLRRRTRALPSWPAGRLGRLDLPLLIPILPIDHLYAGTAWRTVNVERGPKLGSDHYPVMVTLTR